MTDEIEMRWPTDRPYWVGQWQPFPCGRCGKEVDDVDRHGCPRICTVHGIEHRS